MSLLAYEIAHSLQLSAHYDSQLDIEAKAQAFAAQNDELVAKQQALAKELEDAIAYKASHLCHDGTPKT